MKLKTKTKSVVSSPESVATEGEAAREDARPTISSGEFKMVPRGLVRPDPNQPRKEFSEEALKEMAVSIYLQGIIQPLVVKRVPAEVKLIEPDMVNGKMWQALKVADGSVVFESKEEGAVRAFASGMLDDFYQLIAGERRWRSSIPQALEVDGKKVNWPGVKELPCMVRVADDAATFALQNMENQKRINLSALEEARSFGAELERRRAADASWTAERLGEELGIKRGTVFNLMKLLRLKEPVRLALLAGRIETTHARAIAQVPDVKRQEELLVRVKEDADYGEDMISSRALEELIADEYVKQLKDAPFDKENEALVPVSWLVTAGENEITIQCPKRPSIPNLKTIGMPKVVAGRTDLPAEYGKFFVTAADGFEMVGLQPKKTAKEIAEFLAANVKTVTVTVTQASGWACVSCPHRSGVMDPTTKTPNVCSLPSCFDAKVKAHWVKKSEELKAKGTVVLTEGEMRKKGKHIPADKHEYTQNKSGTFTELMGKHAPEPVLVATKEGIKKFYPAEEAISAAKKNGVKFYTQAGSTRSAADVEKEKEEREKREQLKARREALEPQVWEQIAKAIAELKDAEAWALVNEHLAARNYMPPNLKKLLVTDVKGNRNQGLGKLVVIEINEMVDYNGRWDDDAVKICKALGIDLAALEKEAEKAAEPKLPLAKAPAEQKTLIEVKQKGKKIKGKKK